MTEPRISQQAGFDKIEDDLKQFLSGSYTLNGNRLILDRSKWDELLAYISLKFFKAWMSGHCQGVQDVKGQLLLYLEKEKIDRAKKVEGFAASQDTTIDKMLTIVRNTY